MIEAAGLTKQFGAKTVVDDLSFRVEDGSVTGFLGPNGAGKSTTMRMMVGLVRGAGRTNFDGRPFERIAHPAREVGLALDASAVHPKHTARNHLRIVAAASGIAAHKAVGKFSLGMGQRLALAAALLGDPKTVLLDEPTNGLDPAGILWLRTLLRDRASRGCAVFISSHQLAELAELVDGLVVIARGKLVAQSTLDDFTRQHTLNKVRARSPQADELADLLRGRGAAVTTGDDDALVITGVDSDSIGDLAAAHRIVLHELSPERGTLEDAFMDATSTGAEYVAGRDPSNRHDGDDISA